MRNVVLMMSVSLDGYIEGPDREIDWHQVDDELHRHFNVQLAAMGAFLSGRTTWELMAGFWPTADADPACTAPMREFARIWVDKPKIVYSRSLEPGPTRWNTTVVPEVDPEHVRALKAEPGGDLALSGAETAAAFLAHNLVDEYRVYVHPALLGGGKQLFPPGHQGLRMLRLVETRPFHNGVVLLHYARQ